MKPYYSEGGITIYHGDCRDIVPSLPTCDVIITDPPYSKHTHSKQWIGAALTSDGAARVSTKFKELGFDSITETDMVQLARMFALASKRWVLTFCDLESISAWRDSFTGVGLDYVRSAIWDKVDSAPQFTGDRPASAAEAIVIAHPTGKKRWNGGGTRNVFRYAVNEQRGAKPHPTTKPLPLITKLVHLFSEEGEMILDPFMGSGTTLRAAKDLGRKAIGVEREEKYCEIAARRLSQGVLDFAG